MTGISRLRRFVQDMARLADAGGTEALLLGEGDALLEALVAVDDRLPPFCAVPGPAYRQYLLHGDPAERFPAASFVWGPGQRTPIHDHLVRGPSKPLEVCARQRS